MVESLFIDSARRTSPSEPSVVFLPDNVDNASQAGTTFDEDDEDVHGDGPKPPNTAIPAASDHGGSLFSRRSSLVPVFPEDMTQSPVPAPILSPKPMRAASSNLDERLRVLSVSPLGPKPVNLSGLQSSQSLVAVLQDLSQAVQSLGQDVQSLRFEMYALHTDVNKVLDSTASAAEAAKASAEHGHCQHRNNRHASRQRQSQPGCYDGSSITINVMSEGLSDTGSCDCCLKDRETATYYPRFRE